MPTVLERAGDFSQSRDALGRAIQLLDPVSGRPFTGNVIPRERLSPEAAALLHYYPLPNVDGDGRFNYEAPVIEARHQDAGQVRFSQSVPGGKNQLFGNLALQRTTTDTGNVFGLTDSIRASGIDTTVNWSHRFSQLLSLRLRYQFTRLTNTVTPFFANRINVSGEAGITGNGQDPMDWGPPRLQFSSGIAGIGSAQAASNHNSTHGVGAEILSTRGRHNLTFGGDLRRQRLEHPVAAGRARLVRLFRERIGLGSRRLHARLAACQLDRLRQCGQGLPGSGLRRLYHRRLAGEPDPDRQRRRAVGIRGADRRAARPSRQSRRSHPDLSRSRRSVGNDLVARRSARAAAAPRSGDCVPWPALRSSSAPATASIATPRSISRSRCCWRSSRRCRKP